MVRIHIGKNRLEMAGHANAAEPGEDLVCCAISMLTQALSLYMEEKEQEGELQYMVNVVQEGRAKIRVKPKDRSEAETKGAFEVIREGFRALAEDYPEYIKIEEE